MKTRSVRVSLYVVSSQLNFRSKFENALGPFEYDRAGTVLALGRQYSRSDVRKALRGESFHVQYWKAHTSSNTYLLSRVLAV